MPNRPWPAACSTFNVLSGRREIRANKSDARIIMPSMYLLPAKREERAVFVRTLLRERESAVKIPLSPVNLISAN